MPHIHTKPGQYDLTAGAYIVRLDTPEPSIMLHRHKKLGRWFHFGGHVELTEHLWGALAHEITEETGYALGQLKLLQPNIPQPQITDVAQHPMPVATVSVKFSDIDHRHTDVAYAFVAREAPRGQLHTGESADIQLFTAAQLADIPDGEIAENVRTIALFVLQECAPYWVEVDAAFTTSNHHLQTEA